MPEETAYHISLLQGDCVTRMAEMDEGSISIIVCDPPYGISFMGKAFDQLGKGALQRLWHKAWVEEAFRVLKPGGIIKAFGGTRTMHHLAAAIEDAGFEKIELDAWAYGCLSADSEILTESGWKLGLDVIVGERVACWDPDGGGVSFDVVQEKFEHHFRGGLISFKGEHIDQLLTPNHRVYHWTMEGEGGYVVSEAGMLKSETSTRIVEGVGHVLCGLLLPIPSINVIPASYTQAAQATPDGGYAPTGPTTLVPAGIAASVAAHIVREVKSVPYNGEVWCVRVSTGAFVARRNNLAFITGNSGFPKSLNIGKALDRLKGATREMKRIPHSGEAMMRHGGENTRPWIEEAIKVGYHDVAGDTPATDEAKTWDGWGTALKPAWEPVIIGTKPL